MNLRIAIASIVLVVLTGCASGPPIYSRVGTTAWCLEQAREVYERELDYAAMAADVEAFTEADEEYQAARNECMWKKAQAKKD